MFTKSLPKSLNFFFFCSWIHMSPLKLPKSSGLHVFHCASIHSQELSFLLFFTICHVNCQTRIILQKLSLIIFSSCVLQCSQSSLMEFVSYLQALKILLRQDFQSFLPLLSLNQSCCYFQCGGWSTVGFPSVLYSKAVLASMSSTLGMLTHGRTEPEVAVG